jgi:hypothetical protein
MRRSHIAILITLVLAACGADPALPLGIGEPTWPTEATAYADVLAAMPQEIDGLPRQEGGILVATYGEPKGDETVRVYAEDLGGAECPGLFGVSLLRATLEEQGEFTIEESSPDGAEDPTYLFGTRPDGTSLAAWTVPDCAWVVVVEASTPALRDAGVEALVQAASA